LSTNKGRKKSKARKAQPVGASRDTKPWREPKGEKFSKWARLVKCAATLQQREALAPDDAVWLGALLWSLIAGDDIRPIVLDPPTRGRKPKHGDDEADGNLWIAADALIASAETKIKGKALYGMLAEKWGYSDGTLRNLIARYREPASVLIDDTDRQELKGYISKYLAEHNNSR
jgi:hypothetical protein